jgi:ankyrin repeat protein
MKKHVQLVVFIGIFLFHSVIFAGSYEDFFKAVALDDSRTLATLSARGFDPNTADPSGTPALIKALQEKSYKAASLLASHPMTQVDARSPSDENALMLAALRGQSQLVEQLVARGASVNKEDWSPLHYAATGGQTRILAFLIGAGAEVNSPSPNGTTPLMMAAMYGNADCVRLLLESGADPLISNAQDLMAKDFATRAGRLDSVKLIEAAIAQIEAKDAEVKP